MAAHSAAEPDLGPVKIAVEAIKAAAEILHPDLEQEKTPSRAGPLVVVGRFYLSMTLILATVTSVASVVDWKSVPHQPSCVTEAMRLSVLAIGIIGLLLGVIVIVVLIRKHTLYVFSPSELSVEAQQQLFGGVTKEEEDQNKRLAPPPPPEPRPQ